MQKRKTIDENVVNTAQRTMRAAQITAFRQPLQVSEVPVEAPRAERLLAESSAWAGGRSMSPSPRRT